MKPAASYYLGLPDCVAALAWWGEWASSGRGCVTYARLARHFVLDAFPSVRLMGCMASGTPARQHPFVAPHLPIYGLGTLTAVG